MKSNHKNIVMTAMVRGESPPPPEKPRNMGSDKWEAEKKAEAEKAAKEYAEKAKKRVESWVNGKE